MATRPRQRRRRQRGQQRRSTSVQGYGKRYGNEQWKRCETTTLNSVDGIIEDLFKYSTQKRFRSLISAQQFIWICHRAMEALSRDDMLVSINDPNGMAVIGDVHGSFADLIQILNNSGWPTQRTLIFLGDYVDRGEQSVTVIILLLLLKIRSPKRVYLLRGNHETVEVNLEYGLPQMLNRMYGISKGESLFYALNGVFDWLPIAAIASDQLYCCHGGISQFEYDRQYLCQMKRPTSWLNKDTDLNDILILTDTLWSDPAEERNQIPAYVPSDRGISYLFNKKALVEKLQKLGCGALIRAHCPYETGLTKQLDGYCYTIHSSDNPLQRNYRPAILLLDFNDSNLEAEVIYHQTAQCDLDSCLDILLKRFMADRDPETESGPIERKSCQQCAIWDRRFSRETILWDRCLSHEHLLEIIQEFSGTSSVADRYLKRIERSRSSTINGAMILKAATLFPEFISQISQQSGFSCKSCILY